MRSEFRCRGGQFIRPNGFHPFSGDGIAFLHRHTGIGVEHLNATSATPREKVEEMVFADRTRAGRSIGFLQAIRHTALTIQHLGSPIYVWTCSVCRSAVPIFKTGTFGHSVTPPTFLFKRLRNCVFPTGETSGTRPSTTTAFLERGDVPVTFEHLEVRPPAEFLDRSKINAVLN